MTEIISAEGVIRLRPETEADMDFRFRLFCRSRQPEWALLASAPGCERLMRLQFAAQNASYANAGLFIIEMAQPQNSFEPIGRLALDASASGFALVDIALMPDWRGRGHGSAVIRHLQDEARRLAAPLRLSVAKTNVAAERLYRRLGFTPCGDDLVYAQLVWRADV
jgi:ribosomal protein S18 acetylase RimI-like enzyme